MTIQKDDRQFVSWFRNSSPYINAFRGRTFVIVFGGEVIADQQFASLVHDIALLNSLGIKLVLVHGARPQIEQRLRERGAAIQYIDGLRVTDDAALACVKEAAGTLRVEIEALLSMGLANSPMAGSAIRVTSGNFVVARPAGIRKGIDYQHTGKVRRIDQLAIQQHLDEGSIVLLSPLGYSPTGEVFNLTALEVATATAIGIKADKFISLVDERGLTGPRRKLVRELDLAGARTFISERKSYISETIAEPLYCALEACEHGVRRAHLIDRNTDGALLLELFTRDGIGTMITTDVYQGTRQATIDDVGGILELITPLENEGTLVKRTREHLERDINAYTVVERDGMIIACAALHLFPEEKVGELACVAVRPDYRKAGYGAGILKYIENIAAQNTITRLFILTTQATHWFREHGFHSADIKDLPLKRQAMYNLQRKSKVFVKDINAVQKKK